MTVTGDDLGELQQLASAIGLIDAGGSFNEGWLSDPGDHLGSVLADDHQRASLVGFVDDALGGPAVMTDGDGRVWLPIVDRADPDLVVSVVLDERAEHVIIGVGIRFLTASPATATSIHVPLFQVGRGTHTVDDPIVLGTARGRIQLETDVTVDPGPPAPGDAFLGTIGLAVDAPTGSGGVDPEVRLTLGQLQMPGADSPRDLRLSVSDADDLDDEVLDLVLGLVRAQADALGTGAVASVAGLLGLRTGSGVPPIPVADLTEGGPTALLEWFRGVVADATTRQAWVGELAGLLGGTASGDSVSFTLGAADVALRIATTTDGGGQPVITPTVEVQVDASGDARARAEAQLVRLSLGSGGATALPALTAFLQLGRRPDGGAPLLDTGDPTIGGLRAGITLDANRRPTILLAADDVVVAGNRYDSLDLTDADALAEAAATPLTGVIADLLDQLGPAGGLVAQLLGLAAPTGHPGVPTLDAVRFLGDPLDAVAAHWEVVLRDHAVAVPVVLTHLRDLVADVGQATSPVAGTGTPADPWSVSLVGAVALQVWQDGDGALRLAVAARFVVDELGQRCTRLTTTLAMHLATIDLVGRSASLLTGVEASLAARARGSTEAQIHVGPVTLVADHVGVDGSWSPDHGLDVRFAAPNLALRLDTGADVALSVPALGSDGRLDLDAAGWRALEQLLGLLGRVTDVPWVEDVVDAFGWSDLDVGPHLSLEALATDLQGAITEWLGEILVGQGQGALRGAMRALGQVMGGSDTAFGHISGEGRPVDPWLLHLDALPGRPALAVWLVPDGPELPATRVPDELRAWLPGLDPVAPHVLVESLRADASLGSETAAAIRGRSDIASGLVALTNRWSGSDGRILPPSTDPADIAVHRFPGLTWRQLQTGVDPVDVLESEPDTTLRVAVAAATDPLPWPDAPAERVIDLRAPSLIPESFPLPSPGAGEWYVVVAPRPDARLASGDSDGSVGQAARVARIVGAFGSLPGSLCLVGEGAGGHAATAAANAVAGVDSLITLGTPLGPVAFTVLDAAPAADALRLLASHLPTADGVEPVVPETEDEPEDGDLTRARALVGGLTDLLALEDPGRDLRAPAGGTPTPRAGLDHHAVYGVLDDPDVGRSITAVFAADLSARAMQRFEAPPASVTGVRAGVHVPIDVTEGGVTVSGSVRAELGGLDVGGDGLAVSPARALDVHVEIRGVDGAWLVGGPDPTLSGRRPDHELRWIAADVHLPLGSSAVPASAEIVLHEPTVFGLRRRRWVVRPAGDATGDAVTPAVPEVRVLLSHVAGRVASVGGRLSPVADLLGALDLIDEAGGSVPDAVNNLLHDPAGHIAGTLADGAARQRLQTALDALIAPVAGVTVDLTQRRLAFDLASTPTLGGLATWELSGSVDATGQAAATLSVGGTGTSAAGGYEVELSSATRTVRLVEHRPGAASVPVPIWPTPDADALVRLLARLVPAEIGRHGLEHLRSLDEDARPVVDAVLDAIGLLGGSAADATRHVLRPTRLISDPVGWFRHPTSLGGTTGFDAAKVAAFVDALKPVLGVGGGPGHWQLAAGVAVEASAAAGDLRLGLAVDTTTFAPIDTAPDHLVGGIALGLTVRSNAPPVPSMTAHLGLGSAPAPGNSAVHLQLDAGDAAVFLRSPSGVDLSLFPDPPGLGQLAQTAVTQALPLVLDELADQTGADLAGRAGAVVRALGDALALRTAPGPTFSGERLSQFAERPADELVAALPTLTEAALTAIAGAADDVLPTGSSAQVVTGELVVVVASVTLRWQVSPFRIRVEVDVSGIPAVDRAELVVDFDDSSLRSLEVQVGPAEIDADPAVLRPVFTAAVGRAPADGRHLDLGLALDDGGTSTVLAQWNLETSSFGLVARDDSGDRTDPTVVALFLADVLLDLAVGFAMGTAAVQELLDEAVGATTVRNLLRGVVLEDAADPTQLDDDLFDPDRLLARLQRLATNVAGTAPTLTLPGGLTLALQQPANVVEINLGITGRAELFGGDVTVSLEADSRWIKDQPPAGLAVGLVDTSGGNLAFAPSLACRGLGLRLAKPSGPLLDAGIMLGSVAIHVFGDVDADAVAGGAQIQLSDLAVTAGGAQGGNPVAQGMLADTQGGDSELAPSFSPALAVQKHGSGPVLVSLRAGDGDGPWWLAIQKGFGPLYVEQVGLGVTVEQDQLQDISLFFDGRVSILGLTAAVDDLQLTYLVAADTSFFDPDSWSVDLAGIAINADVGGVTLAGGLRKFGAGENTEYVGMLIGRFAAYGLSVYGGYGTGTIGGQRFSSFFAFGAVNGPIGGPPAFFLTGIGGGLGINRDLIFPESLATFDQFPFVKALDPAATVSDDPMAELVQLRDTFPMARGEFWFAAGISFTSFALVDGIAVVSVKVGDGLEVALLGLARVALPRPQLPLVSIELGLIARFSTKEGVLWIQAQLTDNSWLLHESVRLTGGFAFVTWFSGPRAGEFVVTMGGYHPSFHRDGYPQVPRLGFNWQVSRAIVIKGENYFALTSEAMMAGGKLEASAKFGSAWAKVVFGADGIVFFDPFRFEVTVYASISAGVTINVWIGKITIKISIGARIDVAGPKFHGVARFKVGPVKLKVAFGDSQQNADVYLDWAAFTAKYLEEASPGRARVVTSLPGKGALPPGTGPNGTESGTADGSPAHPYEVLSEFTIVVTTTVPTSTFDLGGTEKEHTPSGLIGIAPVGTGSADTRLGLRLVDHQDDDRIGELRASDPLVGNFPVGVWGPPQSKEDRKVPKGEVISAGNGIQLIAEASLEGTLPPEIAYHQVESRGRLPLPLIPERAEREEFLERANALGELVPQVSDDAELLAVAAQWMGRGEHAATQLAALAGERAALPLLGSLSEDLDIEAAVPELSIVGRQPTPGVDSTVERPRAVGLLRAPVLPEREQVGTTVTNPGRATRVRPPTLEDVRAGTDLAVPAQLLVAESAAVGDSTIAARDRVPWTRGAAAGHAAVAIRGADPGGRRRLDELTAGLTSSSPRGGRRAPGAEAGGPATVAAGEIAVFCLPNARRDVGTDVRPQLRVTGDPVRLLAIGFGGQILADLSADRHHHAVPRATERLVVVHEGGVPRGGLAGWHAGQELAFIGWSTALVPGGTVQAEGASVRPNRQRRQAGWIEAAELVDGAAIVRTRFTEPHRSVVVALEGDDAGAGDGLDLELVGGSRTIDADGSVRPPVLVATGNRSYLVYDVTTDGDEALTVSVAAEARWRLVGVMASPEPPARIVSELRTTGLDGLMRPVVGPTLGTSRLRWVQKPRTKGID